MRILVATAALASAAPVLAANYPLELVSPRAVGSSPSAGYPAIEPANRIFKAYPGLEYNIRAAVIGGAYPYTYSLSNAPAGMTINASTGTITWPNPQTSGSATITVRDAEGTQVSSTWAINVTTAGFRFIDAVNGVNASGNGCSSNCGTGTAAAPWRTIKDMTIGSGAGAGEFVYFRNGTYRVTDMQRDGVGGSWENVEFDNRSRPVVWLAYPGHRPLIDYGYQPGVEPAPFIRLAGGNVWVDGFETTRSHIMAFQILSGPGYDYHTFRRLRSHDHSLPGENNDGTNASFIMTTSSPPYGTVWSKYLVIQDSEFSRAPVDVSIKIYNQEKLLIEDNTFHDVFDGIALKADQPQFTVRGNTFYNITNLAIGGNMNIPTTSGEIAFNLIRGANNFGIDINQNAVAKQIFVYRNTIMARVKVRNTDSADGPFRFSNNVIVNSDAGSGSLAHIYLEEVSDPSRVVSTNNLTGYPNNGIVDANGMLTGTYTQYVGSRGHQVGIAPRAPTNLAVE